MQPLQPKAELSKLTPLRRTRRRTDAACLLERNWIFIRRHLRKGREAATHHQRPPRPAPLHTATLAVVPSTARPSTLCHRGCRRHVGPHPTKETAHVGLRHTSHPPPLRSSPPSQRRMPLPKNVYHRKQHSITKR
jgi:hypothetical protein